MGHAQISFIRYHLQLSESEYPSVKECVDAACTALELELGAQPIHERTAMCYDAIYGSRPKIAQPQWVATGKGRTPIVQVGGVGGLASGCNLRHSAGGQLYIQTGDDAFKLLERRRLVDRFEEVGSDTQE